ncbi:30S ribosomal protein S8 [Candidatus Rubidus massiliensis]|nr:MAG: 30S ribosomal protein S8 [Chlamydia sp. 32-24]CDZ80475.1 30S ribosomal protein S8 [Candidatus Rubidus massiliensis]
MALSDPIADFLTRIRNATRAQHRYVDVSWSKLKQNMAEILKNQGFVENYLVKQESKQRGTIRIFLKYTDGRKSVIQDIKRISKPGSRLYVGHEDIPRIYGDLGLSIISTSQGVMAGREARKRKVGGELLCLVW